MRGDRPDVVEAAVGGHGATPHARGSTLSPAEDVALFRGYPACAGIDRKGQILNARIRRLPRMRGDRPRYPNAFTQPDRATPHARGSTAASPNGQGKFCGYPACAGIDPSVPSSNKEAEGLPRMRGDRPFVGWFDRKKAEATPHARGSTQRREGE